MSQQVHIILIPPTTAYTVIFPYNDMARSFDSGFYAPMLTDGRASREDVDRVLREIEAAHKPIQDKAKAAICWYILGLFLSVGFLVPFMIFVGSKNPGLIPVGIIGFFVFFMVVLCLFIARAKGLNQKMIQVAQEVVNRANQQEFNQRGLRWNIPMAFPRWIELWKDYNGQQPMGQPQQPVYMPPVNQQPYGNYGGQPQYNQQYQQQQGFPGYQNNTYVPPGTQV